MSDLRSAQNASQGFILVAVLWILSALAAMASIYAAYVANTAAAVAVNGDAIEVEALVSAAVELTTYRLLEEPLESRPTRGAFSFRLGRANAVVEFCSEAARVDLNDAPKEVLAGLFAVVGAAPNDAAQYAERVVGWRTAPSANTQDTEAVLYKSAGLNYVPRGARFEHVGELGLLLGVPPTLVQRILPFVTVFSASEKVNLLDAAPEVRAALTVVTPNRPNDLPSDGPQSTRRTDTTSGTQAGSPRSLAAGEQQAAIRVMVRVNFDNGRRRAAEVVVLVNGEGDEPYRVLSWQDDIEDPADFRFAAGVNR
jgi:general secretion pathway protein K